MLTVLVAAATVLSLVVAVAAYYRDNSGQTETSSLVVEQVPWDTAITKYVLPITAPLEQIPLPRPGPGCTPETRDWLARNGSEIPPIRLNIRNEAGSGGQLSLSAVQSANVAREQPVAGVIVECPGAGVADVAFLKLDVSTQKEAVSVDGLGGNPQPFAFNLAPGEQGTVIVDVMSNQDTVRFDIVADVAAGDDREERTLLAGVTRSGVGPTTNFRVTVEGDKLYCELTDDAMVSFAACNADVLRARVAGAQGDIATVARLTERIALSTDCESVDADGDALGDLWRAFFYDDQPYLEQLGYEEVARNPIGTLAEQCGVYYPSEIVSYLNLVGVTARDLDNYAIERGE